MKLNLQADWTPYLPGDHDVQNSHSVDSEACGSFSAVHIAEMLIKFNTGRFWEFSERALAKLSGTTTQGNSLENIVNAIKQHGLLLVSDWPELLEFDWNTFYAPLPTPTLKKAYPFDVPSFFKLSAYQVPGALTFGPLWTIIKTSGGTNHIVAQINQKQYYDSYEIRIKNFQAAEPILSQWQLLLTPKNMTDVKLIKNGSEYAFYIPATTEAAIIDKALNFGYPLPTLNNGQNVDWTNVKPEITL